MCIRDRYTSGGKSLPFFNFPSIKFKYKSRYLDTIFNQVFSLAVLIALDCNVLINFLSVLNLWISKAIDSESYRSRARKPRILTRYGC